MDRLSIINQMINSDLEKEFLDDSIRSPIRYAIKDGKRWRPLIYLSLFETSNITPERFTPLYNMMLFLEYIHTSSLILDDLPIMDNDDYRRNQLTLHKKYDSPTAMLCSLQLLLLSQKHYQDTMTELRNIGYFDNESQFFTIDSCIRSHMYSLLGTSGLCRGQYMDLHMNKDKPESYLSMVDCKTGSLFILSFLMGYVFSRRSLEELEKVKELGSSFGIVYQLLDDLEDYETDLQKPHQNNILLFYSKENIIELFYTHYRRVISHINTLRIGCHSLENMIILLKKKWFKSKHILYHT